MKKQKLLTAIIGTIVLVLMALIGCPSEQTVNQASGAVTDTQTAYIKIGLNEISRAALPDVDTAEEFDRFVLTGSAVGGVTVDQSWDGDETNNAYNKMTSANIAVTAGATYSFTLTAKKGGATWSDTAENKQINVGQNSLSFTLALSDLGTTGEGTGNINITLSVPSVVKGVTAKLENIDNGNEVNPADETCDLSNDVITYTATVSAGSYEVILTLFGDDAKTLKLAEWREVAGVADGNISVSSSSIDRTADLDSIYTITYNYNGGTPSGTFSGSYTRYQAVTLPTAEKISRTGYTFGGWFTSPDFIGEPVESIPVGSVGDKHFYAKWTPIIYTITYDNTKDVTNPNDTTYDIEHSITLSPLSKTGWRFDGWWKVTSGDQTADTTTDIWNKNNDQTGNVTFKAGWTPVWYITSDASHDFACGDTVYRKTGMIQVLSGDTVIPGRGSNGVFPSARGSVTLGKYAIGKYEVTQQLYEAVMKIGRTYDKGYGNIYPAYYVSWYDAIVFCNKLTTLVMGGNARCYKIKSGDEYSYPEDDPEGIPSENRQTWDYMTCDWNEAGFRLPTECEWECAARGGTYSTGTPWTYTYSGSNTVGNVAVYNTSSTSPVGSKNPISQTFEVFDMSGNVWEWCWDYSSSDAISASTPVTGPTQNLSSYLNRRQRGGSVDMDASSCTVSYCVNSAPWSRGNNYAYGFRLVCSGE